MLLDTDLPDDPDALRAMVVEQAVEQRILSERIVALVTANEDADAEIIRLTAIITAFQRHRFGARSEKLDDQLELALEELDAALSGVKVGWRPPVGAPAARVRARPSVGRCRRTSIGSSRSSTWRARAAPAAEAISTSSARTSSSGSTSCRPPSA